MTSTTLTTEAGTDDLLIVGFASTTMIDGVPANAGTLVDRETIPMLWRRRLRGLELDAMRCALGVLQTVEDPVDLVFASRHGNLDRTQRQLELIGDGRPPSPLEFSLSVHNALAGMVDLLRHERTGHTSVTAGRDSLAAGLIESYMRCLERPTIPVLLLYVEHPVPPSLRPQTDPGLGGSVLAMLICGSIGDLAPIARLSHMKAHNGTRADSEDEVRLLIDALVSRSPFGLAARTGTDWQLEPAA